MKRSEKVSKLQGFWRWWYADNYQDYLTSWRWKRKRQKVLRRDRTCVLCHSPYNPQVHHRTYIAIFAEPPHHLARLCDDCHNWVEKMLKEKKRGFY